MTNTSTSSPDDTADASEGHRRKSTPGHLVFANVCGIAAAMLTGVLVFYYCLIGTGHLNPPVMGVIPIWTMAIIMSGAVKLAHWAADCAAERIITLIDKRYTTLLKQVERISDEALTGAEEKGQWKGIATAYRQGEPADTTNVVGFGRRGGNAN